MSNTLNWYAGTAPSVAITTGTQTVIGVIVREGDDGNSATSATLNGVAGTLIGRTTYSGASESNITAVLFSTIPSPGNYVLQATGGSAGTQTVTYVYEFNDALTASNFASQDFGTVGSSPFVMNYSVAGLAGARLLVVAAAADTNDIGAAAKPTKPAELDEISDSMSLVRLQVSTGVDSSVLTDPEVYQFTFTDDSLAGGTMGRMTAASFALLAPANEDPVLDTPQADIVIQEGQTGTIDCGANFSDANPGDTLTFSDDNNFAANAGVTFNSATGVFTLDGTLAQGTYNVAVTASDGNGGTYPQDTFTVTITAPVLIVNSVSDLTPQPGDEIDITHSNALDDLIAGDYTVVSNAPGTTRVLIPNPITFVLTGQTYPTINFNTPVNIPLTDGTSSDDAALDGIEPPTGTEFAEITSIPANSIYAATPAIQVGHFGHFFNISGNWVIDAATGVVIVDAAGGSFDYTVYNGEWAAPVTHTVAARPSGTVTIDSLVPGRNGALVNFSYAGADLTGFQYRIDGGSWVAATSPLNITGQTATTEYTLDLVAVNNGRQGDITTVIYSTTDAVDTTPNAFSISPLTGQALSTAVVFAPVTVQGVDAGADVPVSITGGTYSVSTDGGTTWGAQTSSATNVRLNYQIRVHHTTAATHSTQTQTTLTVGGVSATATSTTLADAVAPVITLTGGNQTLTEGDAWSEPGYSATDNADGNLTGQVQVTGLVNTAVPGLYVLSYFVQDAAGNSTTVTRNVTVQALVDLEGITVDTPSTRIIFAGTSSNFWPTFMQDSSDVLDYLIDFGALLQTDTIQSLSVRNTSMTITQQLFEGQKVQLWCKGGREGETAEITVTITSLAGRTIERSFKIRIGEY